MELQVLRKVLVEFLVDVVTEVKARTTPANGGFERTNPEIDRILSERNRTAPEAPPLSAMPRFLSMSQAAHYWGGSSKGFRQMLDRLFAELPKGVVVRVGRRTRVDMKAFEAWLVAKETGGRIRM